MYVCMIARAGRDGKKSHAHTHTYTLSLEEVFHTVTGNIHTDSQWESEFTMRLSQSTIMSKHFDRDLAFTDCQSSIQRNPKKS